MKIGIYGGSFNPPHKMHEEIIRELLNQKLVDTIILVPTGMKYEYKTNLIEDEHRLRMLEIVSSHFENVQVSDFECQKEPVYTYQTLDHFQQLYPNDEVYFICGTDNLSYIDKWKRGEYLLENYHFLVIKRDTNPLEPLLEKYKKVQDNILVSKIHPKTMSSTEIRERLKEDKDCEEYLSEDVLEYIQKNHLYKENL